MPILESIGGITPASLFMIYMFLPLLLVIFYGMPSRFRKPILVIASVTYGLLVQPLWVPMMLVVVVGSYFISYQLQHRALSPVSKKLLVGGGVLLTLGSFVFAGTMVSLLCIPMVLGSTVYPIVALQSIVFAYSNTPDESTDLSLDESMSFWNYALECMFFPKLYAGPFTHFKKRTLDQVETVQLSVPLLCSGGGLFIRGAFKLEIIGKLLWAIYHQIKLLSTVDTSLLSSWTYILAFALAIYFILSGYLDMAKGIGGLFGIFYPEGFYFPYEADSITAFARRFHTTWRGVIDRHVYQPMRGEKDSVLRDSILIMVASMSFGIWFGFTFNYAIWGGFIGIFLILEKYWYPKMLEKAPTVIKRISVILVVFLSFPILTEASILDSLHLYRSLFTWFGGRFPLLNNKIIYIISSNWALLLFGGLWAVNSGRALLAWIKKTAPVIVTVMTPVVDGLLFIFLTAMLV